MVIDAQPRSIIWSRRSTIQTRFIMVDDIYYIIATISLDYIQKFLSTIFLVRIQ